MLTKRLTGTSLILVAVAVAVAVPGGVALHFIEEMETRQTTDRLETLVQITRDHLDEWSHHQLHIAKMWASDVRVIDYIEGHIAAHAETPGSAAADDHTLIRELLSEPVEEEQFIGFFVATPDHMRIASYRGIKDYQRLPEQIDPYLQRALSGDTFITSPIAWDVETGLWFPTPFVMSPIRDHNQKVIAVLAFHINQKGWTKVPDSARLSKSGETYLICDREGIMVSESRFHDDLIRLGLISRERPSSIGLPIKPPTDPAQAEAAPFTHAASMILKGESGSQLTPYLDYRGVPVVGAWSDYKELEIGIISEIDYKDGFQTYLRVRVIYWTTLLTALLLFLIGGVYFSLRTSRAETEIKAERNGRLVAEEERKVAEVQATHDPLTGLPNRNLLMELGRQVLRRSSRGRYRTCLLFMDLDGFKAVNDLHGHSAGDRILEKVASRLRESIRETDILCRWGGDEFVLILEECGESRDVARIADNLITTVSAPYELDGTPVRVGLTVGGSYYPDDAKTLEDLIRYADITMYYCKRLQRGSYHSYNREIMREWAASSQTAEDLRGRQLMTEEEKQRGDLLLETIEALSTTIDQRDPYTANHQKNVSRIAAEIATAMNLSTQQIEGIRIGGLLHDIGKNSIPTTLLEKTDPLTDHDRSVLKDHVEAGFNILQGINFPWSVAEMVHQHHERLDGSGYPSGLRGDEILLEARILAVADTLEAATADRPYRKARPIEEVLDEIRSGRDTLYDADAVDATLLLYGERIRG